MSTEANQLGVRIRSETNETLTRVKKKTGLSKSMLANMGLAYFTQAILDGELVIVNGKIVPAQKKAA